MSTHVKGYFDYNSTTPLSDFVMTAMQSQLGAFANPSSNTVIARANKDVLKTARQHIARLLNCDADNIYFTSGGSEANNWAIKGVLLKHLNSPGHIITSSIEHPSVLDTLRYCEDQLGFTVSYIQPDAQGIISVDDVIQATRNDTQLISIMYANNETGVKQPVEKIGLWAQRQGIPFHVDAVQVVGKAPVNFSQLPVNLVSFSGHKFYGPKGIGGLVINKMQDFTPLIHGGGQESGLRSGTENVLAVAGLSAAASEAAQHVEDWNRRLQRHKDQIVTRLMDEKLGAKVNGTLSPEKSLANTLNVSVEGIRGEALAALLDNKHGYRVSIGSACSNNKTKKLSHVLTAMGLDEARIQSAIRISLGRYTTQEDVDGFLMALVTSIKQLKAIAA